MAILNEGETLQLLKSHKRIQEEIKIIETYCHLIKASPIHLGYANRLNELNCLVAIIDIWKLILIEEDRFIIERHIIEQVDWNKIMVEHRRNNCRDNGIPALIWLFFNLSKAFFDSVKLHH